ncbi:MAG: hypothetical protein EOP04_29935 [Proteobacteria bacterium]|nr:MAG: hypothetical protein EOP04_29935 [Pseudomonadota bacterium]
MSPGCSHSPNPRIGWVWEAGNVFNVTKGAFANATIGVTDIRRDDSDTQAFYKRATTAKEILNGSVTSTQADALKQALPTAQ